VHVQADGRSDTRLVTQRRRDGGSDETVARTNGLATYDWLPDGRLLVSQLEQDGPYRALADLWVMELDGSSRRLTRRARLEQPSVAPGGTWAVAVRAGRGSERARARGLASGA
jgi:hypothetical protein